MAKEFSKKFYVSKAWHEAREETLKRDRYLCRKCGRPALEVHHIIPLSPTNLGDVGIALGQGNLISLCFDCHQAIHGGRRQLICTFGEDGRPYREGRRER